MLQSLGLGKPLPNVEIAQRVYVEDDWGLEGKLAR
jgi:hypothetical protein